MHFHSGLPLRAKTAHHRTAVTLLAPGLAGALWNPFQVYFWLKPARGRRSKKMAVFFMVKGPIFGHFSPNLDLRRPKCRENSERPRLGPLSGHFSGEMLLVNGHFPEAPAHFSGHCSGKMLVVIDHFTEGK